MYGVRRRGARNFQTPAARTMHVSVRQSLLTEGRLHKLERTRMDLNALKYTTSHEWTSMQGQTATVGITDFAVKQLTDLVHIELPRVGRNIRQGETFGEVESVKAVSDLYCPVTGEITAVNEALADDLGVLSDDPFGKGWMIKVKVDDSASVAKLLDRSAYEAHCADESEHA
jgi:glycine cleavage system H protein